MRTNVGKWLVFVLFVLIVSSCSTIRMTKKSQFIEGLSETEYFGTLLSNHSWRETEAMTAKMSLTLDAGGEKTKVNGTMRIKKGEVIQLSIAPLLGIEVARAEISQDGVLVVDRMNKRYVQVSFMELQRLANVKLDFHTLQALFLNEIFLPGKEELSPRDISAFDMVLVGEDVSLDVKKSKHFSFCFLTQVADVLLKESSIGLKDTPYGLQWKYGDFRLLEEKRFPTTMRVSFKGGKKPMNATISLSRLSANSNWETHTKVSGKYEEVSLVDLIKPLLKK